MLALIAMSLSTLSTLASGTLTVPYMVMTVPMIDCPAPILEANFEACEVPGGTELWVSNGFYSPGMCFQGYQAECTQTKMRDDAWPLDEGETAVRCIPTGFDCNEPDGNPRFATTEYDGTTLSAPAFEIRWRSEDLKTGSDDVAWPTQWMTTGKEVPTMPTMAITSELPERPTVTPTTPAEPTDSAAPPAEQTELPSTSLTTDSVAGIAIGVFLASALAAAAIMAFVLRRQRKKAQAKKAAAPESNQPRYQPEPSYAVSSNMPPIEMPGEPIGPRELPSEPVSPENQHFLLPPQRPVNGRNSQAIVLNSVPIEMDTYKRSQRSTGVEPQASGSGTAQEGSGNGDSNE